MTRAIRACYRIWPGCRFGFLHSSTSLASMSGWVFPLWAKATSRTTYRTSRCSALGTVWLLGNLATKQRFMRSPTTCAPSLPRPCKGPSPNGAAYRSWSI